ncbi:MULTISPECIES: MFS transporter [unclassified Sphingobium]|uniref:MFS transporter n=1 Tax=unclassified Sphingobium TaxID=2611147 RepID=UPI002224D6F7|nr:MULTISPECIES: MFS transporter [unclassified Sphingobium]MCW2411915.1 MFS family permease [Sphingobium sp. B8D3D]MCW2415787.1 MFS family permease [Sphingobium sp. B8D3A]
MTTPPVSGRVTGTAWYALALVALTNAMSLLDRNILAILAPRIKADLQIGDAELGLLYGTVFALFYALFSLPLGRLSDGWIRTRILALAIGFWSFSAGLAAFASGFAMLAISRLGVGIGEGATSPAGTSLLFDYFPKHRRGLVMGTIAASIAVGLGMSNVVGGVAAGWWEGLYPSAQSAPLGLAGWQFAFLVASVPGFLLALLLWHLKEPQRGAMDGIASRPDPAPFRSSLALLGAVTPGTNLLSLAASKASARHWTANIGVMVLVVGLMTLFVHLASAFSPRPALNFGGVPLNPHILQWGVMGFGIIVIFNLLQRLALADPPTYQVTVRSPALMIAIAVGALQTVINYGIMGFTPAFIMQTYGTSPAETGVTFGLLSLVIGVIGPMISGPLADWFDKSMPATGRVYLTLFALGVSPLIGVWTYHAPDAFGFYSRFVLYSVILTCWMPPLYSLIYGLVLPRMRGITASTYLIISTIFGLGMGPYLVGMISDATGDLRTAILSVNWMAIPIIILLIILLTRIRKDESLILVRARDAGEPV